VIDLALRIAIWTAIVILSVAMVVGRMRGRIVIGQDGAFRELQRWVGRWRPPDPW
jgi:hypothetical protein